MYSPSFRVKVLLAMLGLVIGVTGATLYVSQRTFQADYRLRFEEMFALQSELFSGQQHWAMDEIEQQLLTLVQKQRIQLALLESDTATLYDQVRDELVIRGLLPQQGEPSRASHASLFVFLDADGRPLLPERNPFAGISPLAPQSAFFSELEIIGKILMQADRPLTAYLSLASDTGEQELHQAVFSRVVDNVTGENLGAFGLVSRVPELTAQAPDSARAGVFFDGAVYSHSLDTKQKAMLAEVLREDIARATPSSADLVIDLDDKPYRVLYQALEQKPGLPQAWLVALLSMANAIASEQSLQRTLLYLGMAGLILSLVLSSFMSHSLSGPIRDLVRGTTAIREGDFGYRVPIRSRDEIGQLSASFNEMASGLAQREKLRNILDMVADKEVAREMVAGNFALGGEIRKLSVLFCDIRGFTALSEGMDPGDVISMLNEHFTPLTQLVYEHHGVVDKFVGDLIMAIFGAPKSYGDDAFNAAQCALAMIRERRKLNETSAHQIEIGIGVASGSAVAGCMGSADRLNYTVLGERVNLASRLCGKAGRMEIMIDATTREQIRDRLRTKPLGIIELKGFAANIEAFALLEGAADQPA
jgi:class 3 adenylate cyclase